MNSHNIRWLLQLLPIVLGVVFIWQLIHVYVHISRPIAIEKFTLSPPPSTVQPDQDNSFSQLSLVLARTINTEEPTINDQPAIIPTTIDFPSVQLVGIIANTNPQKSLAILLTESRQELIGIGEKIKNSEAKVTRITDDEVTLQLSEQKKTLKIPPHFGGLIDQQDKARRPTIVTPLERLKNDLLTDPHLLTEYIRFNPVFKEESIIGYRISAGKDVEVFDALGLQENDLLSAISSIDFHIILSDESAMLGLWPQMTVADNFTLHIKRDNQQYEINIPLQ